MTANNPAGRLHDILSQAPHIQDDRKSHDAWAQLLDVDPADRSRVLHRFGTLLTLPSQVRKAVALLPDDNPELLLRGLPSIEAAMEVPLTQPFAKVKQRLDPTSMLSLEICADRLSRQVAEDMVDDEKLAELHDELLRLLDDVIGADIHDDLRVMLVRLLQKCRDCIEEYKVSGPEALRDAAEQMLGAAWIYSRESGSPSEADISMWKRFLGFAVQVTTVVNMFKAGIALGESVDKALGIGN